MRTKLLSIEGLRESLLLPPADVPDRRYQAAVAAVKRAVQQELTPRQRECLLRRCAGERVLDIARTLGLAPSTVTKHVQTAIQKLQRIFSYSNFFPCDPGASA